MLIERTSREVIIRLPASVDTTGLQRLVDYLIYKEATANSKATQEQIDKLASDVKKGWWKKNRKRFLKLKKIIVDTNIIFSCLLSSHGTIGDLVFNSDDIFNFYSNQYMRFEIRKHWNKLTKMSKLTELELETAYDKMLTKLTFN